jgi:hypothetical protein
MVQKVQIPPDLIGGGVDEGYGKVADAFRRKPEQRSRDRRRDRGLSRRPQGRRLVGRLPQRDHPGAVGAGHPRQRLLDHQRHCFPCCCGGRLQGLPVV